MRKVVLLTVLILGTMAVRAANGFLYLGVGAVRNSVTDITGPYGAVAPDLKNTSWKVYGGVRPLNWLALEVDYLDLGSTNITKAGSEAADFSSDKSVPSTGPRLH